MTKDTRIELRISQREKTLLELACKMADMTISELLRSYIASFIDTVLREEDLNTEE